MKTILFADNSAVVRRSLRQMFEEAGWNVCGEASNGQDAIAKAQELRPNIIVLDVAMPLETALRQDRS